MTASLNGQIAEYTRLLCEGNISQAYRGILSFMTDLQKDLENSRPDHKTGALYQGMMDMSYFGCTPPFLQAKQLKVAIVYLHPKNRFEVWLSGVNRKVQRAWIERLAHQEVSPYHLSASSPGVDSILELSLVCEPDFEQAAELKDRIQRGLENFIRDMEHFTDQE